MIQKGLLDKHGKPNGNTPADWKKGYVDYRYASFSMGLCGTLTPLALLNEHGACVISSKIIGTPRLVSLKQPVLFIHSASLCVRQSPRQCVIFDS